MDNIIQLRTEAEQLLKKWGEINKLSDKKERIASRMRLFSEFDKYEAKRESEVTVGR